MLEADNVDAATKARIADVPPWPVYGVRAAVHCHANPNTITTIPPAVRLRAVRRQAAQAAIRPIPAVPVQVAAAVVEAVVAAAAVEAIKKLTKSPHPQILCPCKSVRVRVRPCSHPPKNTFLVQHPAHTYRGTHSRVSLERAVNWSRTVHTAARGTPDSRSLPMGVAGRCHFGGCRRQRVQGIPQPAIKPPRWVCGTAKAKPRIHAEYSSRPAHARQHGDTTDLPRPAAPSKLLERYCAITPLPRTTVKGEQQL